MVATAFLLQDLKGCKMEKQFLQNFTLEELRELMGKSGFPKFRATQIFKWISKNTPFDRMSDLPKSFVETLKNDYIDIAINIDKEFKSVDGSVKFLYRLCDGNIIEGIYMPHNYGDTICVSTQVGCSMGCAFCASGIGGLVRNLEPGEILGQIIAVNAWLKGKSKITNVVLMGSGEPLDNYENVTKFIRLANHADGLNISQRNISLSTCGLCDKIVQLADEGYGVTLSVSLHATTDEHRQNLMPIAKRYSVAEIIKAVKYYFEKTGRRIIFEYSMVKGENMDFFDAKRLKELTKGYPSHVNLIMLNPVKEKNVKGCTKEEAQRFLKRLNDMGVSATIRRSSGTDVGGACGQLRRSVIKGKENE